MHIAQALAQAHDLGVERLDAQLLLAHVLQQSRAWLIAHDEYRLGDTERQVYLSALDRRRAARTPNTTGDSAPPSPRST